MIKLVIKIDILRGALEAVQPLLEMMVPASQQPRVEACMGQCKQAWLYAATQQRAVDGRHPPVMHASVTLPSTQLQLPWSQCLPVLQMVQGRCRRPALRASLQMAWLTQSQPPVTGVRAG